MNTRTLEELANLVEGQVVGESSLEISGAADLLSAKSDHISFLADRKHYHVLEKTKAAAAVVPLDYENAGLPVIKVTDPNLAFAVIHNSFLRKPFEPAGISEKAVIGDGCYIPDEVSIGPMCTLGKAVKLGRRVVLHPAVTIGDDVEIGDDCIIHPNVSLYSGCKLGNRVIIHSGTVVGADGFGYATGADGCHVKRPHVGNVVVEDDVEVGANVCIDRGTFGNTCIKKGVKIDNLVQIAHNVSIGESSIVVSQVGISGSTSLGRNVVLGGQVGVAGHIELGDRVMVGAKSGVHNNQKAGSIISGIPAIPHRTWLRVSSAFSKLADLIKDVRKIKKDIAEIKKKQ